MIKKYVMSSIGYEKKNKSFENRANFAILTTISLLTITPLSTPYVIKQTLILFVPDETEFLKFSLFYDF